MNASIVVILYVVGKQTYLVFLGCAADLEVKLSVGGKTITGAPYRFARFLYYQV